MLTLSWSYGTFPFPYVKPDASPVSAGVTLEYDWWDISEETGKGTLWIKLRFDEEDLNQELPNIRAAVRYSKDKCVQLNANGEAVLEDMGSDNHLLFCLDTDPPHLDHVGYMSPYSGDG